MSTEGTTSLEGTWRVERISGFLLPAGVTKRIKDGHGWTLVAGVPAAPFRVQGETLFYRGWPVRDELEPDAGFWRGRGLLFGREFCRFRLVPEFTGTPGHRGPART
jgi:hypothetical protein